jgi:hypothetical protein
MARYREETTFTVRVVLSAEFDDDYEGDDDGWAWLRAWQEQTRPLLVKAAFDALRSDRRFEVLPTSRGASPDDEVEVTVKRRTAE